MLKLRKKSLSILFNSIKLRDEVKAMIKNGSFFCEKIVKKKDKLENSDKKKQTNKAGQKPAKIKNALLTLLRLCYSIHEINDCFCSHISRSRTTRSDGCYIPSY